ncbi:SipW-dependent-type signal peptide-containing protein [Halomicrococcus sp. SG-WS-1]|uniref:SipW-dependent-type signal peptide-containing protein n=1 Tax=Halomicrococcus sp. SG-WS-1 TaxID=3439057 RepID=UPI003F791E4A
MSDDKLDLTRRKALLGLGGIGAGAALGGAGTMAYFNDKEKSAGNTVTAGKLDLKIDWWQKYHQGIAGRDSSRRRLTDNPGPIFEISDAKPGDWGCGLISLHVFHNPAYVWAGCDLKKNAENGVNEPESKAEGEDDPKGRDSGTKWSGELAENIKVALLRFPLIRGEHQAANQDEYKHEIHPAESPRYPGDRNLESVNPGNLILKTTLKDLCKNKLHGGYLLDGKTNKGKDGKCFRNSSTYFYGFCWWIPKSVGNEIQSDRVKFALKFGAVQCRHLDTPSEYNPFANDDS